MTGGEGREKRVEKLLTRKEKRDEEKEVVLSVRPLTAAGPKKIQAGWKEEEEEKLLRERKRRTEEEKRRFTIERKDFSSFLHARRKDRRKDACFKPREIFFRPPSPFPPETEECRRGEERKKGRKGV